MIIMSTIKNISPQKARKLMEEKEVIVLDVRAPWEYAKGHIKLAENLDLTDPNFAEHIEKLDKNKKYIVYCKTGRRGAMALEIMEKAGFEHIYNLIGGYEDWRED